MIEKHLRKPSHFLLMAVSGGGCSKYLAIAQFVEKRKIRLMAEAMRRSADVEIQSVTVCTCKSLV
jgi:hypothetical protein